MNRRIPSLLGALTLLSSLLTLAAAGPVSGTAAPLQFSVVNLSPPVLSQGAVGAFYITASNPSTNTSNISQLYLTEKSGAGVYAIENSRPGTCTTSGQLLCNFGALRVGESITVRVALTAPSTGTSWTPDFEFASTGYVLGAKNKSHGDLFTAMFNIPLAGANDDSAGTYVWDSTLTTIQNGSINSGNKQSTRVSLDFSVVGQIPASLTDGFTDRTCGGLNVTAAQCPTSFFGETSDLNINNDFHYGTLFQVVITMYRPGVNPNQVHGIYHRWSTGDKLITTPCPDTGTPTSECFKATSLGDKNIQIVVWLFGNGKINGW